MIDAAFNEERIEALEAAVRDAAGELAQSTERLRERELEAALEASLLRQRPGQVRRQVSVELANWHGRVGPGDLGLDDVDGLALIEVKWGGSELGNCAWDAAKLATALAEGKAASAYLVAGAAAADWERSVEGAELFEMRAWSAESLFIRYAHWFAFWREDIANYPRQVAALWWVFDHRTARFEVAGTAWEVRLAEIQVPSPELAPVSYVPVPATWKRGAGAEPRRNEATAPGALEIEGGAGMGDNWSVALDGAELRYVYNGYASGSAEATITPSAKAWAVFWRELDRIRVWDWQSRYEPEGFSTDGYGWEVRIANGGRTVTASGYEAFPERGQVVEDPGPDWSDFIAALRDLLGGRKVV